MFKSAIVLSAALSVAAVAAACGGGPTPQATTGKPVPTSTPPGTPPPPPGVDASAPAESPDAAPPAADAATDAGAPAAQTPFAQQAAQGNTLYQKQCAECHDSDGTGISAPALVGLAKGALPTAPPPDAKERKTQFKTAFDVGDFFGKTMPPDHKGSLKPDEIWAITAWILQKNGFDLGAQTVDATSAKTIVLHK